MEEKEEKIAMLLAANLVAFVAGVLSPLLSSAFDLQVHIDIDKAAGAEMAEAPVSFVVLPAASALFFGLFGTLLCYGIGLKYSFAVAWMQMNMPLESMPAFAPADPAIFTKLLVLSVLTSTGAALGATFSFLHKGIRREMVFLMIVYIAAVAVYQEVLNALHRS